MSAEAATTPRVHTEPDALAALLASAAAERGTDERVARWLAKLLGESGDRDAARSDAPTRARRTRPAKTRAVPA